MLAGRSGHFRAGVTVRWVHAGLAEAGLPPASFDLVSTQYPALLRTPDAAAERALLAAVAPGGVLLLVHHAGMETQHVHDGGFDPADYVSLPMVTALLDDDGRSSGTNSGRGSHPRAVPARTPSTIWCSAPAGCAERPSPGGTRARRRAVCTERPRG